MVKSFSLLRHIFLMSALRIWLCRKSIVSIPRAKTTQVFATLICATCVSEHIRARSLDNSHAGRRPSEELRRRLSTAAQQEGGAVCFSSLKLALGVAECKFITVQLSSSGEGIYFEASLFATSLAACKVSACTASATKRGLRQKKNKKTNRVCVSPLSLSQCRPFHCFHAVGLQGSSYFLRRACRLSHCSQTKQKVRQIKSASCKCCIGRNNSEFPMQRRRSWMDSRSTRWEEAKMFPATPTAGKTCKQSLCPH